MEIRSISPGFFETMGVRLLRGRFFNDRDVKGATPVVIINESTAKRFFSGQDPIGKTLRFGHDLSDQCQIAGLVPDTRDVSLQARPRLQVYFPLLQGGPDGLTIRARTPADPSASIDYLRSTVAMVDKDQPLSKVQSITEAVSESV